MTESTTLKSDLAKINDTKSAEEVRRAPAKPLNAGEELVKVILNADDSTKALINRALGNPPVRKRKNRDQNSAYIELTYDGFVPVPPEGVVEKGAEAIGIWIENWRMGNHISTGSMDFDSELQDAEALSRIAHM